MAVSRTLRTRQDGGYRTPLFEGQSGVLLLETWTKVLRQFNLSPELVTLEAQETEKFGPYYTIPWSQWKGNLDAYYVHSSVPFDLNDSYLSDVERSYITNSLLINERKLQPFSVDDAYKFSRKGTNLVYRL